MIAELKNDLLLFYRSIRKLKFNKINFLLIVVTMIVSNMLNLINPLLFGNIINGIISKSIDDIKLNMILMCLTFFLSVITNYINSRMIIKVSTTLEMDMKKDIFNSILMSKYSDFNKVDKGKLINNIESDSSVFSDLLSNNMNIVINSINLVTSFCIMTYISPILTLVLILTLPITGIIYMISGNKIKSREVKYRDAYDSFFSFLNETIYGLKFLKLFNSEKGRSNDFTNIIDYIYSIQISKFDIQQISGILINIVSFLANTLSLILGIFLIFEGKLSLGMLTAFNNYSEVFKNSSLSFTRLNSIIQEMSVSITRVNEVLSYKYQNEPKVDTNKKLLDSIQKVEIKDLSYSTSDNIEILKNINTEFRKNNIYLLRGSSGSGKTTILNIISNFIDTYTGEVLINDVPISDIDKKLFRTRVSYITQDNFLFSLSILENISLYRNIPITKIIEVCKNLNIHDTIMSLPNQYETIINKNGTDLSGGEKQRLCIARAMVDNPDIYLFDEITSSVDQNNTNEILRIIEKIASNSIVILTSHEELKFKIPIIEYSLIEKKLEIKERKVNL